MTHSRRRRRLGSALALLCASALPMSPLLADAEGGAETDRGAPSLESPRDKALYALGAFVGRTFVNLDLSEEEYERVAAGLRDAALSREILASTVEYQNEIKALQDERRERALAKDAARTRAYMDRIAQQEGVLRTPSGLLYASRSDGEGGVPGPRDRVRVHYEGRLRDGTVFDSTALRVAPALLPLDSVVACWSEALQRMRVGGRARIVCPPELAYGPSPPPGVPPNAPLDFEVELLAIERVAGG